MVQPGHNDEENILNWIDIFGSLKSNLETPVVSEQVVSPKPNEEKHVECQPTKKSPENSDKQWEQLDMSDIWLDDSTAVKQRIRNIQKNIQIDLTFSDHQTSTPTATKVSTCENEDGDIVVNEYEIEKDEIDWLDATDYTPAQSPLGIKTKTPLRESQKTKAKRSIKYEFDRMNRILDHINIQAVKHHEEILGMERRMGIKFEVMEKRIDSVEKDLKANKNENKENQKKIVGINNEISKIK